MPFVQLAVGLSPAELVAALADPHRRTQARTRLIALGPDAVEAACEGLRHPDARVRESCCQVLDHVMDPGSVGAIIDALADPAWEVRYQALHALACDRCKEGQCRPAASAVLPPTLALLADDPSPHVRMMACEVVGAWAHTLPQARAALEAAVAADPSPAVRKKASWYAPGGRIFRRTASRRLGRSYPADLDGDPAGRGNSRRVVEPTEGLYPAPPP